MAEKKKGLASATVKGTFWVYVSNYTGKFLSFVTVTILARLLTKDDFGLAGYAVVTISFLEVLGDLGIGSALIYHREDPVASDTAFWLNILTSSTLFGLTWLLAPLAGMYFNDPRAIPLIRVLALIFPLSGLQNVHSSLLGKELYFSRKFIPSLVWSASKGTISIVLALLGFGAWSLVWGQVGGQLLSSITYWLVKPWRPSLRFSLDLAGDLLSYGLGLIAVSGLGVFLLNVDYLLIGRYLGATALGVYTLAFRVPELLIKQFCGTLAKVVFPVYSKLRDNLETLRQAFLTTLRYVTVITIPLGLGLALVAEPFVLVVFSPKWREAIPVIRAISIYSLILSFSFNAGDVFKAQGHLKRLTQLSLLRAILMVPAIWWVIRQTGSIVAVGWTLVGIIVLMSTLTLFVVSHMFDIPFGQIITTIRPAATSGMLMAVAVFGTLLLTRDVIPIVRLILNVAVGALVYLGTLWLFQRQLVLDTVDLLRSVLTRS